ncbi:alpha/beta hydrolase [Sulfitobacter maritimus]|uniref:alpha/beta hydrolase n=1 Tax=Sulfitobacter maritimus TaxID=2741719 RepID=UPI0031B614F0
MSSSPVDRRRFLALAGAASLSACQDRSGFTALPREAAETAAQVQRLFVASSRAADPSPIAFGAGRSDALSFAQLSVSIPLDHKVGQIEWPPTKNVDPARHFALTGARTIANTERFAEAVERTAATSGEETVLFVHGYNQTFAQSAYRHAQVAWDYELRGPQILFSWPSAANPLEYTYDRDSILIARDQLALLLRTLLLKHNLRLSVVGHSMGSLLIMEALRQIALTKGAATLEKIGTIALISPDIDMDLFQSQAAVIGKLPQPFIVAVARNDRLLRLASGLSGGAARLGTVKDFDALEDLGVSTIDMTALGNGGSNHFIVGTSPAAIALIKELRRAEPDTVKALTLGPVSIALGR